MLIFHLLFGAHRFLSIKIVSQKARSCKGSGLCKPLPKIKGGRQAPLGLARLDYRRARPGGAVNGGAQSAPFISTIDCPGWGCYPVDQSKMALFMKGACANGSISQFMLYPMRTDISN